VVIASIVMDYETPDALGTIHAIPLAGSSN